MQCAEPISKGLMQKSARRRPPRSALLAKNNVLPVLICMCEKHILIMHFIWASRAFHKFIWLFIFIRARACMINHEIYRQNLQRGTRVCLCTLPPIVATN